MRNGRHLTITCLLLALLAWAAPCPAQTPSDFEARLEVLRNGKEMGEMVVTYTSADGTWRLESRTRGTRWTTEIGVRAVNDGFRSVRTSESPGASRTTRVRRRTVG